MGKLDRMIQEFNHLIILLFLSYCLNIQTSKKHHAMHDSSNYKFSNKLVNEVSPYLLQHAHNPVDWHPWSHRAFEKAKTENKLVIVSIGYSACHWCHVMEHESFEDEEVARVMNENFISIKVDREERPDVDNIYMDAVHLMGQQGGWPLNCIALPDGKPVFGGTYFPKDSWVKVLEQVSQLFHSDSDKLFEYANKLNEGLKQQAIMQIHSKEYEFSEDDLNEMVHNWKQSFDWKHGGSQGAPKFPMPNGLSFLLEYFYFTKDEIVRQYIELTLDKMASGGIYDHIGGGFARYSTDEIWKVPHFEKMLYDNGQLISVYSNAYKLFKKERYKEVVYQTVDFLNREFYEQDEGYFSALDADSEGVEGKYYVWTFDELFNILGNDAAIFNDYYTITKHGNWEQGVNVIHNEISLVELGEKYSLTEKELKAILKKSNKLLMEERNMRIRPGEDTKILTSWNGLAIVGLIDAYRTFGDKTFLERAIEIANYFNSNHVSENGTVSRLLKAESDDIAGFLDDYALLGHAFFKIYETTFDEFWLKKSKLITDAAIEKFFDSSSGMFYYNTTEDSTLFSTKHEIQDNVIPSSNSIMANLLYKLGLHFELPEYTSKAEKMLSGIYPNISKYGPYFSNWGMLLNQFVFQPPEVVFAGADALIYRDTFDAGFHYANMAGSLKNSDLPLLKNRIQSDNTLIYVCRNKVCKLPVDNIDDVIKQLED